MELLKTQEISFQHSYMAFQHKPVKCPCHTHTSIIYESMDKSKIHVEPCSIKATIVHHQVGHMVESSHSA